MELNHGLDFVNLDDVLVDLKLAPEVLEVPIPSYFKEDKMKVLNIFFSFWFSKDDI